MVLGNVLCALNLASSFMVNGACCFYEMQKEEERKREQDEVIRNAIRSEWERHHRIGIVEERREKQESFHSSSRQRERRRKLMAMKNAAVNGGQRSVDQNACREDLQNSATRRRTQYAWPAEGSDSGYSTFSAPQPKVLDKPVVLSKAFSTNAANKSNFQVCTERPVLSLLDSDDDDLDEVPIE